MMEGDKDAGSTVRRQTIKFARKMAFSKFVAKCLVKSEGASKDLWSCCSINYISLKDFHRHVSVSHTEEIDVSSQEILKNGDKDSRWSILKRMSKEEIESTGGEQNRLSSDIANEIETRNLPNKFTEEVEYQWLPKAIESTGCESLEKEKGRVLLFYHYRDVRNVMHVYEWQKTLCERLRLTGKIRVSCEGLNATVGGSFKATQQYMDSVIRHPLFVALRPEDFKESPGGSHVFPDGLRVGVFNEACPMGVSPHHVSFKDRGEHLSPQKFHQVLEEYHKGESELKEKALFVDCRNFYEWKIGQFKGAITPNIRKFSYWPEYIEKNKDVFKDKQVYMYCTGGIRCERGSAYLKSKGICNEVFQLKGGIHKYIDEFPEGYFKGKLFVFDDRYAISANMDVISNCVYCDEPWDKYQPCSGTHCHQLVLSCPDCRDQGLTACCHHCQRNTDSNSLKEECDCTLNRPRIPTEGVDS